MLRVCRIVLGIACIGSLGVLLHACADDSIVTLIVPDSGGDTTHTVYYASNRLGRYDIFVQRDTTPTRIAARADSDSWWPRVSPAGTALLFYRAPAGGKLNDWMNATLYRAGIDGKQQRVMIDASANQWTGQGMVDWSRDGKRLVMSAIDRRTRHWNIYITDSAGRNPVRVSQRDAHYIDPSFSPDGTRIVCAALPPGAPITDLTKLEITVMNVDGTGEMQLTSDTLLDDAPAWSPDGSEIVFSTTIDSGTTIIRAIHPDGTGLRTVRADGINLFPRWSANGARIYCERRDANYALPRIARFLRDGSNLDYVTVAGGVQEDVEPDPGK